MSETEAGPPGSQCGGGGAQGGQLSAQSSSAPDKPQDTRLSFRKTVNNFPRPRQYSGVISHVGLKFKSKCVPWVFTCLRILSNNLRKLS